MFQGHHYESGPRRQEADSQRAGIQQRVRFRPHMQVLWSLCRPGYGHNLNCNGVL
jgi:hypothetical protein